MTDLAPTSFPVIWPSRREALAEHERLGCPRTVPWSLVAPHEAQAVRNHHQSLAELARRGGLDPHELYAVLRDRAWQEVRYIPLGAVVSKLREAVAQEKPR